MAAAAGTEADPPKQSFDLYLQHDLPKVFSVKHVLLGGGGLLERENTINDGAELAGFDET